MAPEEENRTACFDGNMPPVLDMGRGIVFTCSNQGDGDSGYCLYDRSGLHPMAYGRRNLSQLSRGAAGVGYISEDFDLPPQLVWQASPGRPARTVFASNPQQARYAYGRSERITYRAPGGKPLQGALFYPAGYDPAKRYPMVVWVYDYEARYFNVWRNPSWHNAEGFNMSNLTLEGYFVLMPDFAYRKGAPGFSAAACTDAALDAALARASIDPGKIGLIGHSFGGYETNFIITQSGRFAAAVSGAGVSDNVSTYFNITRNGAAIADMWRFESQQWRIGASLYEDQAAYLDNSPVLRAVRVSTPLFLWSGKEDRTVPVAQSLEYYLALRRLGKPCLMALYSGEGHSLEDAAAQEDLTRRVQEWFGYWLKGEPCPWIRLGVEEK
jgi:dipeptidyl aminopeptidase/acylaminoacyl peptidase